MLARKRSTHDFKEPRYTSNLIDEETVDVHITDTLVEHAELYASKLFIDYGEFKKEKINSDFIKYNVFNENGVEVGEYTITTAVLDKEIQVTVDIDGEIW